MIRSLLIKLVTFLCIKPITLTLARVIESEKPVFTLLFGCIGVLVLAFRTLSLLEAPNVQSIIAPVAVPAATGAFIDFLLGKAGQARVKDLLLKIWVWLDDWNPGEPPPRKGKVHQISLVTRVSRNTIWSRITQVVVLISVVIYLTYFSETAYLYIAMLAFLSLLSAADAGLIWWRAARGEYGLSKLEVTEIARLIAAAQHRRNNRGDPGSFVRVFPEDASVQNEWVWADIRGVRS